MDQYPDENEEYELMYQEELELLGDIQNEEENYFPESGRAPNINNTQKTNEVSLKELELLEEIQNEEENYFPESANITAPNINNTQKTNEGSLSSPHLSQINPVNRRLFGSQSQLFAQRGCSTPAVQNKQPNIINQGINLTPIPAEELLQNEIQALGKRSRRRLERDLFGDIDDLYGYESYQDPEAKKAKTEEERDLEAIEKILEVRRRLQENNQFKKKDNLSKLKAIHDFKMRNLSYEIPNWPFLPLSRNDGQRIYARFHSEEYEDRAIKDIHLTREFESLLGEHKAKIWDDANEMVLKQMTNQNSAPEVVQVEVVHESGSLWVDKYKPKKYMDLLSDEGTNRDLLCWLKMWDKVVFGKEFNVKPSGETNTSKLNSFNKRTGKFESTGGWRTKKHRGMLDTNRDELGRPVQKVALLCGPPGLGKTTLAHTIARHAGYEVREVNASDDRTPEAFKMALENGTQMSSVLNECKRPNCIILDEIDGAPRQSIEFLVKFVTDAHTTKVHAKGAKAKKNILKRPIICICNDLYDPALRTLRQIAFVVTVPAIDSARLAERLVQIAKREKLKTDFGSLIALAEKSGNDVRSCISTMQFFNAQKNALTLHDVLNNNLGTKDRHQGLFDVWGSIFRIQRPKKKLIASDSIDGGFEVGLSDMSIPTRAQNVLNVVHSSGDYDRLMQGVYENYLHQKMPDPNMNGVAEAAQWFAFSDTVNHQIHHLQNYTVYPYLQYGFVVWHLLFASLAWPKINFPTKSYEFNQKSTTMKNIFLAFRRGIKCEASGVGQGNVILTDTLPLLKNILSPQMRSVDVQLLSAREKENLRQCVEIMADLGLTFIQVKTMDGHYQFQLEPDIETLGLFPGYPGMKLPYFARQLISREVEIENIRRSRPKVSEAPKQAKMIKKPANHLQTLKPKRLENTVKEMVTKDFFGRVQEITAAMQLEEAKADPIVKSPIWYRYKEGFNNAVRKDVHLNELI